MSEETPRTDALIPSQSFVDQTRLFDREWFIPLLDLARQLERELALSKQQHDCTIDILQQTQRELQAEKIAREGMEKDAARYRWLRERMGTRQERMMSGPDKECIYVRPGHSVVNTNRDARPVCMDEESFQKSMKKLDEAIDSAIGDKA
jgi:hypothetical protein